MDYIFADQKTRGDLAILWLYRRYCAYQGFHDSLNQDPDLELEKYNDVLLGMLTHLYERGDHKEQ